MCERAFTWVVESTVTTSGGIRSRMAGCAVDGVGRRLPLLFTVAIGCGCAQTTAAHTTIRHTTPVPAMRLIGPSFGCDKNPSILSKHQQPCKEKSDRVRGLATVAKKLAETAWPTRCTRGRLSPCSVSGNWDYQTLNPGRTFASVLTTTSRSQSPEACRASDEPRRRSKPVRRCRRASRLEGSRRPIPNRIDGFA